MIFEFETEVQPDWIDYNGHMRDSYFGLVFSLAVDAMQDEVGFDQAYRERTGCTIYLLEDHKYFLREVKEGSLVRVKTRILGCDAKRFHLHMQMLEGREVVAVGEFMELHVNQHPSPHAAPIPAEIFERLRAAVMPDTTTKKMDKRSRPIGLWRGKD